MGHGLSLKSRVLEAKRTPRKTTTAIWNLRTGLKSTVAGATAFLTIRCKSSFGRERTFGGDRLSPLLEPPLRVQRRHAPVPGRGDGLAVPVVVDVPRREHAGQVGGGAELLRRAHDDVAPWVEVELSLEDVRGGRVPDRDEQPGDLKVLG